MARRCFFVVNPHSSDGKTGKLWPALRRRVQGRLGQLDCAYTRGTMHAAELTAEALRSGYSTIVAVGGDGTVNEVLNGFYENGKAIRPDAELAFLPSGTGGDLARTLGTATRSLEDLLLEIPTARTGALDAAEATFRTAQGEEVRRLFINEVSVGFSANIARTVNEADGLFSGQAAFFVSVFRCLAGLRNQVMRISVDDAPWYRGPVFFAAVCNGRYFGGGMKVAPEADMTDGLFDLVLVKYFKRLDVVRHIAKVYRGEHLKLAQVRCVRCRKVEFTSDEAVPIEMDGEQPGFLSVSATVCGRAVRFLLPK